MFSTVSPIRNWHAANAECNWYLHTTRRRGGCVSAYTSVEQSSYKMLYKFRIQYSGHTQQLLSLRRRIFNGQTLGLMFCFVYVRGLHCIPWASFCLREFEFSFVFKSCKSTQIVNTNDANRNSASCLLNQWLVLPIVYRCFQNNYFTARSPLMVNGYEDTISICLSV